MNRTKIIIAILSSFLAILYLMNFVIYQTVVSILNISGDSFLVIVILGVLGVSIITALALGMRYYNLFTRSYYLLSMIWLGFLGYFFPVSVLYIALYGYVGESSRIFGLMLFCSTVIVGIYGLIHANKFIIKEITIKLPNLPEAWRDRKALWISDIHLGQIYSERYMERIVKKIQEISPDIVFIGGDLYDGTKAPNLDKLIAPLKNLSAPLGIYFITGNHEEFGDNNEFIKAIQSVGILVLQDKMVLIDGLQLIGVDYTTASNEEQFKKILSDLSIDKNKTSILLKHEPKHLHITEQAGISLQLSGHTHKAQQWPLGYLANLIYGRFVYGLNKLKNTQVYTSSGIGTWGPPIRVGTDSEMVIFNFAIL